MTASVTSPGVARWRLWFGLFGAAIAWLLHLIGAAIIAEWGCLAGLYRHELLGITAVAWLLIAISAAMSLAALAATGLAYQVHQHYRQAGRQTEAADLPDQHGTDIYMAQVGLWSSLLFLFIIFAQCVPIFFYLREC